MNEKDSILSILEDVKEFYKNKDFVENEYFELEKVFSKINSEVKLMEIDEIKSLFENELNYSDERYRIYILSFLMQYLKNTDYIKRIFDLLLNSTNLTKDNKLFIINQINGFISMNSTIIDDETYEIQEKVYNSIIKEYRKEYEEDLEFIPKEFRNDEFIMVFSSQILSINHKPTEIALNLCYLLQEKMKKKVVLIDTNELLSPKGIIPFYRMMVAAKGTNIIDEISYKQKNIPFYKVEKITPDKEEYLNIISIIKKYKPSLIFSIGDKIVINDICNKIVDGVTIALGERKPLTTNKLLTFYEKADQNIKNNKIILNEDLKSVFEAENYEKFIDVYKNMSDRM